MLDVTDLVDFCHENFVTSRQGLMSIGNFAYRAMVEMALGFQKVSSYTEILEKEL